MIYEENFDKIKQHRIEVVRNLCGNYAKGKCKGDCPECLERTLKEKQENQLSENS